MRIIKIKVPSYVKEQVRIHLDRVYTSGTPMIIGGYVRWLISLLFDCPFVSDIPNDVDVAIIRGRYIISSEYHVDHTSPHGTLEELFSTRDITINEVACDGDVIYVSERGLSDLLNGRIRWSGYHGDTIDYGRVVTSRLYTRAVRMSVEYGVAMSGFINRAPLLDDFDVALQGWKLLKKNKNMFIEYLDRIGYSIKDYYYCVLDSHIREKDIIIEEIRY